MISVLFCERQFGSRVGSCEISRVCGSSPLTEVFFWLTVITRTAQTRACNPNINVIILSAYNTPIPNLTLLFFSPYIYNPCKYRVYEHMNDFCDILLFFFLFIGLNLLSFNSRDFPACLLCKSSTKWYRSHSFFV